MKINIFQTFANTSVCSINKSLGFSITYAIVTLVVVGVVLAGLTPVLTRKLPNLSTSSIIKNPKGWYESFNAPISGKYCSECKKKDEEYNNCLKEKEKNPNSNKECKDPWPDITIKYDKTITTNDQCFGNPACIPYINPDDLDDKHIVPFEQYCKSNGNCNPDPDILKDVNEKLCYDANVNKITGKLKDKLKPCPCPKGKCKFKPQTGITKYEVYAIGGGGGSGSAVASKPSSIGITYEESVVGHPKKNPTELPNSNLNTPIDPKEKEKLLDNLNYPKANEVYPDADFIDQNRIDTKDDPYKPSDFPDNKKSQNANYPNILGNLNVKCATGIIYTIGKKDNNFHTYPTEDSNSVLAKSSTRQIKKILGNKEYLIGKRSVRYYDRYYLYTRYLGAYAYNQNPIYLLMPEWVKVDSLDKKFPSGENGIDTAEILLEKENIKSNEVTCINQTAIPYTFINNKGKKETRKTDVCNISYIKPNEFPKKDHTGADSSKAILSDYSTTAGVACSGDGGEGGDVHLSEMVVCEWMKPNVCKYKTLHKRTVSRRFETYDGSKCEYADKKNEAPPSNEAAKAEHAKEKYCLRNKYTYRESREEKIKTTCMFDQYFYNKKCIFREYLGAYVKCTCDNIPLEPTCKKNNDVDKECKTTVFHVDVDPNAPQDNQNKIDDIAEDAEQDMEDVVDMSLKVKNRDTGASESLKIDGETGYVKNSNGDIIKDSNGDLLKVDPNSDVPMNKQIEDILDKISDEYAIVDDEGTEQEVDDIDYIGNKGAGTPKCDAIKAYSRDAFGGGKGNGICIYKLASITRDDIYNLTVSPKTGYTKDEEKASNVNQCGNHNDGIAAGGVEVCINNKCAKATGGGGGTGAEIKCDICTGAGINGKKGADAEITGSCASYSNNQNYKNGNALDYSKDAMTDVSDGKNGKENKDTSSNNNKTKDSINTAGTQHMPGRYNYRYIWYMPFVTKHLMFGLAGEGGEEVHSLVTLSEGQSLVVIPGIGAAKTDYKSGANGENGGQSEVRSDDAKVKIVAHGGKGGLGSQKTDEYVLCHISDLQKRNPNLPCYYESVELNDFKSTHKTNADGKFVGILATQPRISTTVNSIKMSAHLKQGTPGMGAMGFGTKSVSDVICNERHVTKWDEIEGKGKPTAKLLSSGGKLYNICKGNSKIKYIIPNGSKYTAGTGAVIIIW